MFRALLQCLHEGLPVSEEALCERPDDENAREVLTFIRGLRRFAFYERLRDLVRRKGMSMEGLLADGDLSPVIRLLVTDEGMNYAGLPKGLLLFHEYENHNRTAFEEHLVESWYQVSDSRGRSRVHFTVSPEHRSQFQDLLEEVRPLYEQTHGISLDVTFSVQNPSTDTIAVDWNNRPFRGDDGRLVFRPGGHGALLENLHRLQGDIVFIKNIDNVVPDRLKGDTIYWKKILGGYLMDFQKRTFAYMDSLRSNPHDSLLDQITTFAREELRLPVPDSLTMEPTEIRSAALRTLLNRPIRVCGMVPNEGEPGGGPFWVQEPLETESIQIVEGAQLDPDSEDQRRIFQSSSHFNPVDLVCGVRNVDGTPFDLTEYVDPHAIIITKKSSGGKELKALEHPGLWNGAMARWITLLVEVPITTFNPVKTVNDLLRDAHQPS
jgi:hypothetical protein